jgi:histidinol-phosphate aminotransferase
MLDRFAALAGGELARVPWAPGPFPLAEFLARLDARTAVIAVVSPNNPTGGVASAGDVRRLAEAAPGSLVLLDHAYVEYADEDLTSTVGDLPNVLVLRTLSKAWGLAGCRVGFAIGSPKTIAVLRAAGGPYPVAAPSAALALAQLACGDAALREHVARVRDERRVLTERLAALGLQPWPSQANFVFAQCGPRPPAPFLAAGLAALGVVVRDFPDRPGLEAGLRITLPGDAAAFTRLVTALDTVLAPEALLLHFDGALSPDRALLERLHRPLAIVTGRRADLGTQRAWMVASTPDDVRAAAGAGVLPLALVPPGDDPAATAAALREAGAARVLDGLTDLLELLP